MAEEFFIPKLGQTVEEVTLVSWLVEDGAKVTQGQAVMEVETDKAIFPVEANARGVIHIGPFKAGMVLPVLTVVAVIGKPEDKFELKASASAEATPEPARAGSAAPEGASPAAAPVQGPENEKLFASPRARKLADEKNVDLGAVSPTGYGGVRVAERDVLAYLAQAPKVTPVAQHIAAESGIDLRTVSGTGPGGRIVKKDIARHTQTEAFIPMPAVSAPGPQAEILERIPLKGVRAIIVERMAASVHTTARVTLVTEVDATEFVAARTRIKEKVEKDWGFAPGYNDLLARIVAAALRHYPYMNARLTPDAIEILGHVNMGMAVDTERGLLVPVIRDADQKSLHQFGAEFRTMVEQARNNRLMPDNLTGGTFTITNLGMYDVDAFTPVINLPELAILGVGRIAPKPVARGEGVVVRQMLTLSLVFDHRLVDGAPAARFLQYIKQLIEEPYLLLAV
jgi:pyruvate dehydrogenase E2 component (dihydrolipoamide acetyltransferase)